MPIERLKVAISNPTFDICVVALQKGKDAGSGKPLGDTAAAQQYNSMLVKYTGQLAGAIDGPIDALLSPPSGHGWQAEPYRAALVTKFPGVREHPPISNRSHVVRTVSLTSQHGY